VSRNSWDSAFCVVTFATVVSKVTGMQEKQNHPKVSSSMLRNLPSDINRIIKEEQIRLEFAEGLVLKRPEVYYRIIREWKDLKLQLTNK
jgi:hypothetical protein